jgi:hypothetical protein
MGARIVLRSARVLVALLSIGAGAGAARAQPRAAPGTIDGVVTDTNLVSLADATASILGSSLQVVTGANGRFRIRAVPAGHYVLIVRRLGYAPSSAALQVAAGDTLRPSFALVRSVTALDTVVVAGKRLSMRMAEFEDRRKMGEGHFMTQAEIEKRNTPFVSELLRSFLSVSVRGDSAENLRTPLIKRCTFKIFIDGVGMPKDTKVERDLPTPKEIGGIEVYSGPATIPLQYKTTDKGGFCGVILIWTRDGS